MSQWSTTDSNGIYKVKVPYGKYRVDGFELSASNANKLLPGKIFHPYHMHSIRTFKVDENQEGNGIKFRFVDPVIKIIESSKYGSDDEIILKWKPYPKADSYLIQLHEKTDKYSYKRTRLFSGQGIKVKQTEFEVTKEVDLKSGYSYSYDIIAVDKKGETISITDIKHREYDFEIID